MNLLFGIGLLLLLGVSVSKLAGKANIPAVTAYLLVGIAIGPHALNVIPQALLSHQGVVADGVLAVIAFMIGRNFSADYFRRLGRQVLWISVSEAVGAWVLVTAAFFVVLHQDFAVSMLVGAIASATAPAATVSVIRQYRARGPLTETLVGVVAVDDAWCLILSALSLSIFLAVTARSGAVAPGLARAVGGILLSLLVGAAFAWLFHRVADRLRSEEELAIWTPGIVLLTAGVAMSLGFSVLLTAMALGSTLVNLSPRSSKYFRAMESFTFPLYEIFFVMAGASLEVGLIPGLGLLGLGFIVARAAGKMGGAYLGARLSGAVPAVRRYLGLGLLPQAGVALGVALTLKASLPESGGTVLTLIVGTTVVQEILGPPLTRIALVRAGEAEAG